MVIFLIRSTPPHAGQWVGLLDFFLADGMSCRVVGEIACDKATLSSEPIVSLLAGSSWRVAFSLRHHALLSRESGASSCDRSGPLHELRSVGTCVPWSELGTGRSPVTSTAVTMSETHPLKSNSDRVTSTSIRLPSFFLCFRRFFTESRLPLCSTSLNNGTMSSLGRMSRMVIDRNSLRE